MPDQAETLVVFSTANFNEIGIRTLAGEYVEVGQNHGRKYYRKTERIPGMEGMDIFLYYWDDRDSTEFQGWWFGDALGGTQVWSRHRMQSQRPPAMGWTIPWDGPVRPELCIMSKMEKQNCDKAAAMNRMQVRRDEEDQWYQEAQESKWEERVAKATEKVVEVEIDVKKDMESASKPHGEEALQKARAELQQQQKSLINTLKYVSAEGLAAKAAPQPLRRELFDLTRRLRGLQAELKEALLNLQAVKEERPREPYTELESAHLQQLEEMMPELVEKIELSEDEVEKVTIAAAPLHVDSGEDLQPVMLQAVKETEKAVRSAQAAIGEARRFISGKLTQVQGFEPVIKKEALDEFSKLQEKLTEAQTRLNPFKTARQDYEKRVQFKKLLDELSTKLAGAEIEVEKAAMMSAPLDDNLDGIKETETTLATAQSLLAQSNRQIESKLRLIDKKSDFIKELKALQERGKTAQEKLDEVRRNLKETQGRIVADQITKEVSDKVANAEDELQKMADAELPFLQNDPDQDLGALFSEAEKVAAQVQAALMEAQGFVARKLVEVAKLSEGPQQTAKAEVDMLQKRLEEGRDRNQQFRSSIADRKRAHLLQEVEVRVVAAEEEVKKMTEATAALPGLGKAGEVCDNLTETLQQANHAERAAQASVVTARKYLLQKTAELKKLATAVGSGGELGRLQTRVHSMQQDIAKLRASIIQGEERLKVKEMLAEVSEQLHVSEGEVEKVAASSVPGQEASVEQVQAMEQANGAAKTKLEQLSKLLNIKLRSAQGFLQEELNAMQSRIKKAEKKLDTVIAAAKEQRERLQACELTAESLEKVERCEAALQKASEAERPFQKDCEVSPAEAQQALADCEATALAAQKAISEARSATLQCLTKAKEFGEAASDLCTKDQLALQKRLDGMALKLNELKKAHLLTTAEKVSKVEAAVKQMGEVMARFSESSIATLSKDEAQKISEEGCTVEQTAQACMESAKRFLGQRMQEAKTLQEAQRVPFMADLSKLQSRLTAAQVEVAKLSKQLTEREQSFVAVRLSQDVDNELRRISEEGKVAAQVCQDLLEGEGHAKLLLLLRHDAVVEILQDHISASQTVENLWEDLSAGDASVTQDRFADWLQSRSEVSSGTLTKEQTLQVWPLLVKGEQMKQAEFQDLLLARRCAANTIGLWNAPSGGREICQLYEGEAVQILDTSDERPHCRLLRDGSSLWVASAECLQPTAAGQLASLEAYIKAAFANCNFSATQTEQKAAQVASIKQGPLVPIRSKLLEVSKKLTQEKAKLDILKSNLLTAKEAAQQEREAEVKELMDAKCKAFQEESSRRGKEALKEAEEATNQVLQGAEESQRLSLSELEALQTQGETAFEVLKSSKGVITQLLDSFDSFKGPKRTMLLQARVELNKINSQLFAMEQKCGSCSESLRQAHAQALKKLTVRARNALRHAFRQSGLSPDSAFLQAARSDQDQVSEEEFLLFVSKLGEEVTSEQAKMLYKEFARSGMFKGNFLKAVQEYGCCVREVAMTGGLSIGTVTGTIRKILMHEVLEILEGPCTEEEANVQRVRCRALKDGKEGWITIKGNQGTPFLKPREKPFLLVAGETEFRAESELSSEVLRKLQMGEKLELLEGPREVTFEEKVFLQGVAADGSEGFVLLQEMVSSGIEGPSDRHYVCKSTIAMTDVEDITSCKVLCKIQSGDLLEALGDPVEGEPGAIPRRRFLACGSGQEGWVTLTGNAGTVYLEQSQRHWLVASSVALRLSTDDEALAKRALKEELFEEKARRTVRPKPQVQMKARSLVDWTVGWVSFVAGPNAPVKPSSDAP
ncbi:unnamed protein product [Effrenium voratum]|nr:unnamed protein product [Effrenium voratum]